MNTPHETTRPGMGHRAMAAALVAAVLLSVIGYAVSASRALRRTALAQHTALLALPAKPMLALDGLDDSALRTALATSPLTQATANVAMVRQARMGKKDQAAAWLAILPELGWRDTPSLQNLLYDAALTQDFRRVLDFSDALLRRRKLLDQMFPLIAMVEADPDLQDTLVAKLATRPNWRDAYLGASGVLTSRRYLLARFSLLRKLQRQGVRLRRDEVIPSINALDRNDLPGYGFALWRTINPQVRQPLDDLDFAAAGRNGQTGEQSVAYQWQLMTGEGFSVTANGEGGSTSLDIDWNGRGVPVFAQQRTSATPGRYALVVTTPAKDRDDLQLLMFRLVCGATTVAFERVGQGRYVSAGAIPCAYPLLQITGDVQSFATAHSLSLNRIAMAPLALAGR